MTGRREFLTMALAGSVVPIAGEAQPRERHSEPVEIENSFLRARFDTASGYFAAWHKDGSPFVINGAVRATGGSWARLSSDREFVRTARSEKSDDTLGHCTKILAECNDAQLGLVLTIEISLYDERNALLVSAGCQNRSGKPLMLRTLEPFRTIAEQGALVMWEHATRVLTNGFIYYDPGRVLDFRSTEHNGVNSVWNVCFAGDAGAPGLAAGYIENRTDVGKVSARAASLQQHHGIGLIAESGFNREFIIDSGAAVRTSRFVLLIAPDAFAALESYAQMMADAQKVRLNPIINGWCNWFYTHNDHVNEQEIVNNAEFAALHLKPYGLEWIQIDDGYQKALGDWQGNEHFSHGMKWLADRIRAVGLRPGIWIAPYVITEGTDVHRDHPEWLIRNLDGSIRHCNDRDGKALYGLDISVPEAAAWLRRLFEMLVHEWGYDFIKLDFVEWTILAAERFHDPRWSKAIAYRKGVEIMREVMGPDRHLLDCGPSQITTGLIDSVRIELDLPFLTWEQYVKNFNSNAPAMAKRYYFHKRTWINDVDHLGVNLLTPSQACVAASIIALSGGTMINGDRLFELDPARLEIIQKVFPAFGEAAKPIDLFDKDRPEIFFLPVKATFEQWIVVGLFNYDENAAAEKSVILQHLAMDSTKRWLAFEFWSQSSLGVITGQLRTLVPPASVALIALREDRGVPQILSTDRHFTQGGVELRSVQWSPSSNTLQGVSLGGPGIRYNLYIHVPHAYAWDVEYPDFANDSEGWSAKMLPNGLLRAQMNFGGRDQVAWAFKFRQVSRQPGETAAS